ncbi:hypothetical protein GCM10025864_18080 [Luteimicrobium album]|uniref:Uncharacterized protein n=1 Tax=Luteimicrobium album TaxID=1054550 RepID=A0ABQ6I2N9_9MICO|nr:hypothetical protein GCM10025864_18080 [Luteimicrobium album]
MSEIVIRATVSLTLRSSSDGPRAPTTVSVSAAKPWAGERPHDEGTGRASDAAIHDLLQAVIRRATDTSRRVRSDRFLTSYKWVMLRP